MTNNEPSLEEIDDFNGRGSEEKRKIVNFVVMFCLLVGAVYTIVKLSNNTISDEIQVPARVEIMK